MLAYRDSQLLPAAQLFLVPSAEMSGSIHLTRNSKLELQLLILLTSHKQALVYLTVLMVGAVK